MKCLPIYLVLILVITSCAIFNKKNEPQNIELHFDGTPNKRNDSRITIYFTGGFNEHIKVQHNNTTILDTLLISEWSVDFTGIAKTVNIKDGNILEVTEIFNEEKFHIKLIDGYRILELSKYSNKWTAIYTNKATVFE